MLAGTPTTSPKTIARRTGFAEVVSASAAPSLVTLTTPARHANVRRCQRGCPPRGHSSSRSLDIRVTEVGGLALLLAGLAMLGASGALAAACIRLRSSFEYLLAAYVIAWTWLVGVSYALSPLHLLTRGGLLVTLATGLAVSLSIWLALGRPVAPVARQTLTAFAGALRDPAVLALSIAVVLGVLYIGALAFLTPVTDWDGLSYHLPRAAFWRQEQALGYIEGTADLRLNVNPPNAEIGQLATMLLTGTDRYVVLPQLVAYLALSLCVAGLARRHGLSRPEALFGALALATLPVLAVQAQTALNDLVVASFLACAALFGLGSRRASLVLFALAVGLAVGTKFIGLIALPTLVVVLAFSQPPRRWLALALAGAAGIAVGSAWYLVNLVEAGALDGGAAERFDQFPGPPSVETVVIALRHALSFIDMSGAPWTRSLCFLVGAVVLAAAAGALVRRSRRTALVLVVAGGLAASVMALPLAYEAADRAVFKAALVVGAERGFLDTLTWDIQTQSHGVVGYGPLAAVLLVAGTALVVREWTQRRLATRVLVFASAPWILLVTLALALAWDPWRMRFLAFGLALAASTWGIALRSRVMSFASVAVGATALALSLGNIDFKPSGFGPSQGIWSTPRWVIYGRVGPELVYRYVERRVPQDGTRCTGAPLQPEHPCFLRSAPLARDLARPCRHASARRLGRSG